MAVKTVAPEKKHEPDLKAKSSLYLWPFVAVNVAIFLSVVVNQGFPQSLQSVSQFWSQVGAKNGIIAVSIPIAVLVLGGVLSDMAKARLVFWRWHNPLPGCRAFSHLVQADPRIDAKILNGKYGRFPRNPSEQNALWYKIYREHKIKSMVWASHRVYLLTRDLAAIAACFLLLLSIGAGVALVGWKPWAYYSAALFLQYALIAGAARNYGYRFVQNVLCEECNCCRVNQR